MSTSALDVTESNTLRASFREWLQENLPNDWKNTNKWSEDLDQAIEIRRNWGRKMSDGGWAAPHLPKEYGGMGLSFEEVIIYTEELARSEAPEALNANSMGILAPTMVKYGTEVQKNRYLPSMIHHDEVWCQGFSEPGSGSDLASLQMKATKVPGGYTLSGQKIWTSRAQYADLCYMLMRTDPNTPTKYQGITLAVVNMHQASIDARPIRTMVGTSDFCEVFVDGAFVADDDVIGTPGDGWEIARYALTRERGPRLVERAFKMEKEFKELVLLMQSGTVEASHAARLVDVAVEVRAVAATLRRMLDELAAGSSDTALLASVGKLSWSETHQKVLKLAIDHLGSKAVVANGDYDEWMRSYLFSRAETIYGGTSEVQRNMIARLAGLPTSSRKVGK